MSVIATDVPGAASMVGVTDKAIRAAIHSGELMAKRQSRNAKGEPCGKYLIKVIDLEVWFDGLGDA